MSQITVCIPFYKLNLQFLSAAINSVLEQSSDCWQLIIVDGSKDKNNNVQQYVKALNKANIGYVKNDQDISMAGNWNFAVSQAKSEFVTLLHDDDLLAPNYVEQMLTLVNQYPNSTAYYCDVKLINSKGNATWTVADKIKGLLRPNEHISHLIGDEGLSSLLKGCYIFCPTICYRKSKITEKMFNKKWQMVADLQCYVDLLTSGQLITGVKEKLYCYRRHDANQTSKLTQTMLRFQEEVALYDQVTDFAKVVGWSKSYQAAKQKSIIKMHLLFLLLKSSLFFDFNRAAKVFRYLHTLIKQ